MCSSCPDLITFTYQRGEVETGSGADPQHVVLCFLSFVFVYAVGCCDIGLKGAGWGFGGVYLDIIMIKLEICLKNMKRSPEAFLS